MTDGHLQDRALLPWSLLEAASEGVFVADREGYFVKANRRLETMLGYEPGELLGRRVEELVPESLRAAHVGQREAFHGRGGVRRMGRGMVLLALRKDGSEMPVEIGLGHAGPEHGHLVIGFLSDISERQRLVAMERVDAERATRLRMLAETTVALAHHLRNAAMAILGQAELTDSDNPGVAGELQRVASTEGHHITAVVDALLELADSGETPLSSPPFQGAEPMIDIDALVERHWRRRMAPDCEC